MTKIQDKRGRQATVRALNVDPGTWFLKGESLYLKTSRGSIVCAERGVDVSFDLQAPVQPVGVVITIISNVSNEAGENE